VVSPNDLWHSWSFDPAIVTGVVLLSVMYALGVRRLWSKGRGRGITVRQSASFAAGIAVLAVALISPLDRLSVSLFSAHMVQHLLLMVVAAPLLVAGSAGTAIGLALPVAARRTVRGWERNGWTRAVTEVLIRPVPVLTLHLTALYLWHLPVLYQAALSNDAVHGLEHACFFGTAWLFWWLIIDEKGRRKLGPGGAVLFVFLAGFASGALGALLTFAPTTLYPIQALGAHAWGLTPLEDQQLAGLIMWVPAGAVYVLTAAVLFLRWLSGMDAAIAREGGAAG
jgi:cytochrome c oxidase assembly factor CtaG